MHPVTTAWFASRGMYRPDSRFARERIASMRDRLRRGEAVYLLGIPPSGHNSGIALVEATAKDGVRLICNEEEERYSGIKHDTGFPERAVASMQARLQVMGLEPRDIHATLAGWNYVDFLPMGLRTGLEHAPMSLAMSLPRCLPKFNHLHAWRAAGAPARLGRLLGADRAMPIIAMRHHDNHAYFSYGVSPFNRNREPVMVTVLDGYGDAARLHRLT